MSGDGPSQRYTISRGCSGVEGESADRTRLGRTARTRARTGIGMYTAMDGDAQFTRVNEDTVVLQGLSAPGLLVLSPAPCPVSVVIQVVISIAWHSTAQVVAV